MVPPIGLIISVICIVISVVAIIVYFAYVEKQLKKCKDILDNLAEKK